MTTAQELEQFAQDREWSYRQLAREIQRVTGRRISYMTLSRFCTGRTQLSRLTRYTVDTFIANAKSAKRASKRRGAA